MLHYAPTYNNIYSSYEVYTNSKNTNDLCNILQSKGLLIKKKHVLSVVLKNLNMFIYKTNIDVCSHNFTNIKWFLDDVLQKKLNSIHVFNVTLGLIKPPFVIKSVLVPKKLRKKSKKKYLVKIVYKNENKRIKSALKQLCHYSNKFNDGNFNVRLYKSILFSFLD